MNALERLTTPQSLTTIGQHTPAQAAFRRAQAGRTAGPIAGTKHTAFVLRRWPNGTTDLVRLDQDGQDYLDLGGKMSVDVKAGRI